MGSSMEALNVRRISASDEAEATMKNAKVKEKNRGYVQKLAIGFGRDRVTLRERERERERGAGWLCCLSLLYILVKWETVTSSERRGDVDWF